MLKCKDPDLGTIAVCGSSSLNGRKTWHGLCSPDPSTSPLSSEQWHWDLSLYDVCLHRLWTPGLCPPSTGLGSAPHIHVEGSEEGEIQLVCTAGGWFPKPQVYWEDMKGEKLLTFSEYHIQDEDGLFYVEDTLVVRNASAETVSCFIHNPVLTEEKGSVISIPGQCSPSRTKMLRLAGGVQGLFHNT